MSPHFLQFLAMRRLAFTHGRNDGESGVNLFRFPAFEVSAVVVVGRNRR
jgi:hypothetical protein